MGRNIIASKHVVSSNEQQHRCQACILGCAHNQGCVTCQALVCPQTMYAHKARFWRLQEDEQTTRSAGRHGSGRRTSWGFVVNLPATSELQAYATARAAAAAATATRQSVHLRLSQPTSADLNTVGGAGSSAVIPKITRQSQEAVPAGGHGAPQQPAGARSAEARSSPSAKTKLPQGGSEVHASSPATATGSPRGASTRSHHEQVTHLLSEGGVSLETVPVQGKVLSQTRLPSVMDEGGSAAVGRPPLLAAFEGSRLFHCPDAVQAMADAHDAGPLLHGLQVAPAARARPQPINFIIDRRYTRIQSHILQLFNWLLFSACGSIGRAG